VLARHAGRLPVALRSQAEHQGSVLARKGDDESVRSPLDPGDRRAQGRRLHRPRGLDEEEAARAPIAGLVESHDEARFTQTANHRLARVAAAEWLREKGGGLGRDHHRSQADTADQTQ